MLVQQAIFTSVRSGRNEGYQLAARSPGISEKEARELAQWGPSHDSLCTGLTNVESVNCHQMTSGVFCISQSLLAGREYSGRGGQRVYTHMFLVPAKVLARFANNPFRVVESLVVSGRTAVRENPTAPLDPLPLVGRSSGVNKLNLQYVVEKLGADKLASLVSAAMQTETLGISSPISANRLFAALIDLLPLRVRTSFSLTTGLKVSAARPFRLASLPCCGEEHRRAIRQVRLEVLDLTEGPPPRFAPNLGWPQLIYQVLRSEQYESLSRVIDAASESDESDCDQLAEQLRERLDKEAEDVALSAFPA